MGAYSELTTSGKWLEDWGRANGKKTQFIHVGKDVYNALWGALSEEVGLMMEFWALARENCWAGDLTAAELGVSGLVSDEEAFARLK